LTKITFCSLLFTSLLLISACNHEKEKDIDVSSIAIEQPFLRFDKELFASGNTITAEMVINFRARYRTFFDLYCDRILRIHNNSDSAAAVDLTQFINDTDVKEIHRKVDSLYSNTDNIQKDLQLAFRHYKYYFPQKHIPAIVTYLSAFNYQVITADSILGIGLDMYLGNENELMYGSIGIPIYMSRRFSKDYILCDALKGWFQGEYEPDKIKTELLSQMIYNGKLLYFIEAMAPGLPDTILTGYTKAQLDWCKKNESNIWAFFIEQKLLYSTVIQQYIKYINDGPTTNGLPKESPAKLGAWIGWRIVNAYMDKNSDVSLEQLFNDYDAQKILNNSNYKPKK
jgi:hypothetical protein